VTDYELANIVQTLRGDAIYLNAEQRRTPELHRAAEHIQQATATMEAQQARIRSLAAQVEAMREGLKPVATLVEQIEATMMFAHADYGIHVLDDEEFGVMFDEENNAIIKFRMGDFRRARALLAEGGENG
jgi:methyl-accepting chemotaxis protein